MHPCAPGAASCGAASDVSHLWLILLPLLLSHNASAEWKPPHNLWRGPEREIVSHPEPSYPLIARQRKITGSGIFLLRIDALGAVASVRAEVSTGSPILDKAAIAGFRRWRLKPGPSSALRTPITFFVPTLDQRKY